MADYSSKLEKIHTTLTTILNRTSVLEKLETSFAELSKRLENVETSISEIHSGTSAKKKRKQADSTLATKKRAKPVVPNAYGKLVIKKYTDKCLLNGGWFNKNVRDIIKEFRGHYSQKYRGWIVSLENIDKLQCQLKPWFQHTSMQILNSTLIPPMIPHNETNDHGSLLFLTDSDMDD